MIWKVTWNVELPYYLSKYCISNQCSKSILESTLSRPLECCYLYTEVIKKFPGNDLIYEDKEHAWIVDYSNVD